MSAAARRSSLTRSVQGVAPQCLDAARAAAIASRASCAPPLAKRPSSSSRSMGERTSKVCAHQPSRPSIQSGYSPPSRDFTIASAASKRWCSSSGGSNIVE